MPGLSASTSRGPQHWHITRDIKPKGVCPACDLAWKVMEEDAERRRPKPDPK